MRATRLLSSGDVCSITGLPMKTLDNWCRTGVIQPVRQANGHGHHRRFTLTQTVALSYAGQWSRAGAAAPLIATIVGSLQRYTEAQLLAEFRAGRNVLVISPSQHGDCRLIEPPAAREFELLDIQRVYDAVVKKVAKLEQVEGNRTGRNRGLQINL